MKHNLRILILFFILFVIIGCSATGNDIEKTTISQPVVTASDRTLTVTEIVTSTPPVHTPTLLPTGTKTQEFVPRKVNCFQPSFDKVSSVRTNGVIVLSGEFYYSPSYLLNMQSGEKVLLERNPDERLTGFSISTDQKWLAFQMVNNKKKVSEIHITGADGKLVKAIDWDPSWRQIAGWLDAQTLLISKNRGDSEIDSNIRLNPFTEEQNEIEPNYPKLWLIWVNRELNWGGYWRSGAIYNANLTRVIYPVQEDIKSGIVLWNISEQKEIVSLFGGFGYQPKWKPDNQGFIINLSTKNPGYVRMFEDLFYVNASGNVRQVTHLSETEGNSSIGNFEWSLDGESIAFWLSIEKQINYPDIYPDSPADRANRLAIVDFRTGNVVDTCVPGDLGYNSPVWSLDGKYIIVEDYYGADFPFTGRVLLVDLTNLAVLKIAENVTPIGWMQP